LTRGARDGSPEDESADRLPAPRLGPGGATSGGRPIRLAGLALAAIRREAARAYPSEGCGALVGPAEDDVTEAVPLPNAERDRPRTRFAVSPRDYMRVEDDAEARGLRLLGFWHSHPDHPARPSPTDRQFAWEGLLTLVIAVEGGEPGAITAWDLPALDAPFRGRGLEARVPDEGPRPGTVREESPCPAS
jgi:proteasome lid subunit RPN8/RPN11